MSIHGRCGLLAPVAAAVGFEAVVGGLDFKDGRRIAVRDDPVDGSAFERLSASPVTQVASAAVGTVATCLDVLSDQIGAVAELVGRLVRESGFDRDPITATVGLETLDLLGQIDDR